MSRVLTACVIVASIACCATASAQVSIGGFDNVQAFTQERLGENHFQLSGAVQLERGDLSIYADSIEFFQDEDRAIARGNVVISQGSNRIAADWAEFNTKTQLGTFHQASGIATVRQGAQRPIGGGVVAPGAQSGSLDNDVYYFGETVEKLGPKKYKITNGGFSTCVQPTPRWDLTADTIILNIDHYTVLRQAQLNVKGVPMLYLPFLYYPTKEDERATGFLIPTYGVSTIRGQSLHNAFFWAINRSQDATFLADWFSRTGYGTGAQYRYNMGGGSDGNLSGYLLDTKATSYPQSDGTTVDVAASRSFDLRGGANQALPHNFRARAQVDYFSDFTTNQTFNTNVYDASRNRRTYGGNVVGVFRGFSLNGTFNRNEYFNTATSSSVVGDSPRIGLLRTDRPLFGRSPIYFGASAEYAHLDRLTLEDGKPVPGGDLGFGRMDFAPQIRYPFKRWPFLTVNSTLQWRETFYTRSFDPATQSAVDTSINREYFTGATQIVGPVFTRVWNTPDNGYAEKFKHTIEPYVNIQRTTAIVNNDRILKVDSTDYTVGDTTSIAYGLNNRFYAKRRLGRVSQSQEILALEITQTYYTDATASIVDPRYTSTIGGIPSKFSPVAVGLRVTPTPAMNAAARAEFDSQTRGLRTVSANTSLNLQQHLQAQVGWSKNFLLPGMDPNSLSHYLNVSTNLQTRDRRYGLIYSFNYDLLHSAMLQERVSGFYNSQCCGVSVEYQRYNFGSASLVPADSRFFMSFTLAGLGNFSPFNGALGGIPR